jgi:transcription elongation factor GreA
MAEESEWFRVTGTAARGEVQVLRSAVDPVVELRRKLESAGRLADLLVRVRDTLSGATSDDKVRAMALEVLAAKAKDAKEPLIDRFTAWLVLRDEGSAVPQELSELLASKVREPAPQDGSAPAVWKLFQSVQAMRDQERCVRALMDAHGEGWADEGAKNFQHAPPGMARPLLEALLAKGKNEELAAHYRELLARPLRAPEALLQLARAAEGGRLKGSFPPAVQRAEALLSLASYLFLNKKSDPAFTRVQTRLSELLCKGKEPLLRRLLEGSPHGSLEGLQRTLQRGVDEDIDRLLTSILARAAPPVSAAESAHFWESDRIWTTREGLERRRGELRILREEKIPANQDAIGKAAAMGDLSENSEWEMAIQEQEKLTTRAAEIEGELRVAELIENAILPENTVCPGTFVRYRDLDSASEHEIEILGPWDTEREHVVSYRAPLAAGLLGRRPGDRAKIKLPSGEMEVEVLTARPAELG